MSWNFRNEAPGKSHGNNQTGDNWWQNLNSCTRGYDSDQRREDGTSRLGNHKYQAYLKSVTAIITPWNGYTDLEQKTEPASAILSKQQKHPILISKSLTPKPRISTHSSKKWPKKEPHHTKHRDTRNLIRHKPKHQLHRETNKRINQQHSSFAKSVSRFCEEESAETDTTV